MRCLSTVILVYGISLGQHVGRARFYILRWAHLCETFGRFPDKPILYCYTIYAGIIRSTSLIIRMGRSVNYGFLLYLCISLHVLERVKFWMSYLVKVFFFNKLVSFFAILEIMHFIHNILV